MQLSWRKMVIGALIVAVAFISAAGAIHWLGSRDRRPALATVTPLAPVTRSSTIVAPVAIRLSAIRDALEKAAPPELSGKPEIPALPFLKNVDISWSVSRGPIVVTPRREGLAISTSLNGSMRSGAQLDAISGNLLGSHGDLRDLLGSLLRGDTPSAGREDQSNRTLDQRAEIRGSATLIARPNLLPQWRLEPNLSSEVTIGDASLSILGTKLSVPDAVKPLVEKTVNEQVSSLQARLRDDPILELSARQEWAKMCRSVSIGATAPGMPNLWLEVRPTRAFAAQPGLDETSVLLTLGVQADTRIVPSETKPDCPFPDRLDIVQQMEQGRFNIAVPIDIPFAEIDRLMEAQLKGKVFPEDKSGAFTATIRGVNFAASGDRLLISVAVRANETKTWFGFGADATIHVWGRPILDRARQVVRLDDLALDVESEAAFGMLGVAARAALPYLQKALAENAVIDLVPAADNARRGLAAAVTDFRKRNDRVQVDAEVTNLRLVDLEFDAQILRVITEAEGTARAVVMRLDN
jgi:hypothetical protein